MKLGWVVNLLLLVGVIGLGVYVWHRGNQPAEPSYKLSAQTASAATKISVAMKKGGSYALEKRDNAWYLIAPLQARADQTQVQRVLDLLAATSKEQMPATELKRFDLDAPPVSVTVDGQTFAFGTINPLTQEQYIATGNNVYLVQSYYASQVPVSADRMLAHNLFRQGETPAAFTFKSFNLTQKDGKWTVTPAPAEEKDRPSQDELNRWVDDWRFASSLSTQPAASKPATETISVKLSDGKTLDFSVLSKEPELVLVRKDEKLEFHFSGEMSKRLLQPVSGKEAARAGAS
jgi:Domain of unknown function (DUF4340)